MLFLQLSLNTHFKHHDHSSHHIYHLPYHYNTSYWPILLLLFVQVIPFTYLPHYNLKCRLLHLPSTSYSPTFVCYDLKQLLTSRLMLAYYRIMQQNLVPLLLLVTILYVIPTQIPHILLLLYVHPIYIKPTLLLLSCPTFFSQLSIHIANSYIST